MKLRLWTRSPGKYDWKNEVREFARIPVSGECLALSPSSPWYLVQLVVHMPYPGDCEAEVYSMQVDRDEMKQRAFYSKA